MNLCFGTKAETLRSLKGKLVHAVVDDLVLFDVQSWLEKQDEIINEILHVFPSSTLAIRSSAQVEDSAMCSNAGRFESVLNVIAERNLLIDAVNKVIESFEDGRGDNQVFVQKYLGDVEMSGVLFTRDINNFAPYFIINFDDETGKTDTITSGQGNYKTFVSFKHEIRTNDKRFTALCENAFELERIFGNDALDIEFIIVGGIVHIVQVRPLVKRNLENKEIDYVQMHKILTNIFEGVSERNMSHPDLFGKRTLYGVMPDWNPAEMIGTKPRPLAISLYRELVTDTIWAYQRDNYGYKRLRSFPLLVSLAGQPYIDLRVDFNSFLPKNIDDELSHKLTDYYLDRLVADPSSHDKIEFDIVLSCYSLDLDRRLKELPSPLFAQDDISTLRSALLDLTTNIIKADGLFWQDLKKIKLLEDRRVQLLQSDQSIISKIYWLIEDCKRYGTLPFAGIARAAFIATQFLNSFVELEIITLEDRGRFLRSLNSITKQFSRDLVSFRDGEKSRDEFISTYGHLRPGTYDILSACYEDNFDEYFDIRNINDVEDEPLFEFSEVQRSKIEYILQAHSIQLRSSELIDFMREAISGREYAKFIFTKNVSALLEMIKEFGEPMGLLQDDLSYLEIGSLVRLYSRIGTHNNKHALLGEIERNRETYHIYCHAKLPDLICDPNDIFSFTVNSSRPNYVTSHSVTAKTIKISGVFDKSELCDKIVFIENADPGFDWIFSHNIKGFVTMYGGANSHMAIRAAELGIPAVVGCGMLFYSEWGQARTLHVDCLNKKVVKIN